MFMMHLLGRRGLALEAAVMPLRGARRKGGAQSRHGSLAVGLFAHFKVRSSTLWIPEKYRIIPDIHSVRGRPCDSSDRTPIGHSVGKHKAAS
jgi:hypothetical protein